MRMAAGLSVTRICELAGIHRSTWYRWAARARDGEAPARAVAGAGARPHRRAGA